MQITPTVHTPGEAPHEQPYRPFLSSLAAARQLVESGRTAAAMDICILPGPNGELPPLNGAYMTFGRTAQSQARAAIQTLQTATGQDAPAPAIAAARNAINELGRIMSTPPASASAVTGYVPRFDAARTWIDVAQSHATLSWIMQGER